MKRRVLAVVSVAVLGVAVHSQSLPAKTGKAAGAVRETLSKWAEAVRVGDQKALNEIFADDLYITLPGGEIRDKKGELDALKPTAKGRNLSITNEDIRIKMFGEASVVTATMKWVRLSESGKQTTTQIRYTAVLERRQGRWQLTVLQAAVVPVSPSQGS